MPGLCWRLSQGEELGWLVARLWQAAGSGEPRIRVFAPWQRTEQDKRFRKVGASLAESAARCQPQESRWCQQVGDLRNHCHISEGRGGVLGLKRLGRKNVSPGKRASPCRGMWRVFEESPVTLH